MERPQPQRDQLQEPDKQTSSRRIGGVALEDFRKTVPVGDFYAEVTYLHTLLTTTEISQLAGGSLRAAEDWLRRARQSQGPRKRLTPAAEPIRRTMAVLEYMETELGCPPEAHGGFLRSYVIDPDSHEAVNMLDLIREDRIPQVIERAEQMFQPS